MLGSLLDYASKLPLFLADGTLVQYPQCSAFFNGSDPKMRVIVTSDFASNNPIELSASLAIPFGSAGWLALLLHTIAIELYVSVL
jgi:hypothetical protein